MKSPMTRGAVGLIVSLSTLWSVPSHALTLDETIQRTQAAHPQFKAYSALQRASRADVDTLSLAPPIILNGEADNLIGNGSYQQAAQAEYTLALSSVIELGGQRRARHQQALSAYELTDAQSKSRTLSLLSEVTRAYIATLASQERLRIAEESLRLNKQTLAVVEKRHQRGAAPKNDQLRAEAALERSASAVEQARLQLDNDIYRLTSYWMTSGEPRGELSLTGNLFDLSTPPGQFPQLLSAVDDALVLQVYASKARLAEADSTLTQAQNAGSVE